QHRRRRLERREGQGEHAAERGRIDRYCRGGHALSSKPLDYEATEGMSENGWLPRELADGVNVMIRDLLDALVGKDLWVLLGLLDGLRIIGPAWREGGVALLFKQRAPAVPTVREEPEAMHKHDRWQPRIVGAGDLLLLMGVERGHVLLLCEGGQMALHCF